jgi:hypothetical protein
MRRWPWALTRRSQVQFCEHYQCTRVMLEFSEKARFSVINILIGVLLQEAQSLR